MARRQRKTILGRKLGMSQLYGDNNVLMPITLIEAGPCTVLQVKTEDNDGYSALQVGFDDTRKEPLKPQQGLFKKVGTAAKRWIREIPPLKDQEFAVGDQIDLAILDGVAMVDISGVSKGRGFSGRVRRWGQKIGPRGHGSKNKRVMGSTGMHQDPGRVQKGKHMPGQHGAGNVKVRNLRVVSMDAEQKLLVVHGAVPGPTGGYLYIQESLMDLEE